MEISQDVCLLLLAQYQNHTVLWNARDKHYYNNAKKEDAWSTISAAMGISKDICQKKMESLKGSYRREKAKIKKSISRGQGAEQAYKSRWFAFNAMAFLGENCEPRDTIGSLISEDRVVISVEPESSTSTCAETAQRPTAKRKREDAADDSLEGQRTEADTSDECSSFGTYVSSKLKAYSDHERALAQHRISTVLFDIDMAKYQTK